MYVKKSLHQRVDNNSMPPIHFRCPTMQLRVQSWIVDDPTAHPEQNRRYEPVTCPACMHIHLIDPKTDKVLLGEKLARRVWGPREDRAIPNEELPQFSDQRLLIAMFQSASHLRRVTRRSVELIEQSQIMLRGLKIQRPTRG